MTSAPAARLPLDGRPFDVAIIGGGINGVAIARECARAGRPTLLVEQNDFASGTTSRSTRIIHGGLRYLEHGEIGLVRESVRERQRLLRERPHLVRPMQFVLALPRGRRHPLEVRFGIWLYRKYAGGRKPSFADDPATALEKLLDRGRDPLHLFSYEDAQCEFPERLVAEWLTEAIDSGATVRNHTRVLNIERANGKVHGLRLCDLLTGSEYAIAAAHIVNAAGPWADSVCQQAGISTRKPMIGGVRGSHIVLPLFPGAPASAIYTEAIDRRPVFLIPWNHQILFGTTEVSDSGDPGRATPDDDEIRYLLDSLRRLFPHTALPEISFAFAGVRPLPYAPGEREAAVTRRHFLYDHKGDGAEGLLSVIGGKLTTAASLARECARKLGCDVPEPNMTAVADLGDNGSAHQRATREIESISGLSPAAAANLLHCYGEKAFAIANLIAADDGLRQPLADVSDHVLGEAMYAVRHEAAVTLADLLLRRIPVALNSSWSEAQTRQAAARIGEVIGWDSATLARQIDDFEAERSAFLVRLARTSTVA